MPNSAAVVAKLALELQLKVGEAKNEDEQTTIIMDFLTPLLTSAREEGVRVGLEAGAKELDKTYASLGGCPCQKRHADKIRSLSPSTVLREGAVGKCVYSHPHMTTGNRVGGCGFVLFGNDADVRVCPNCGKEIQEVLK